MINTLLASVALLATTTLAQGVGSAIVVNNCNYEVHLQNTPSDDGVHQIDSRVLSPGGTYSQQYTGLNNDNGWSLKLSQDANWGSEILQYEYTYHPNSPTEPLWFDLSEVDGNPWDGNWEITATGSCTPRQAAYRFATDDAYGMQDCPVSSSITVTVCSGDSGSGAPAPAPSSPAESAYPTSAAPAPSDAPAPSSPAPASTYTNTWWGGPGAKNVEQAAGDADAKKLSPTTLVTSSVEAWTGPAVTITNLHYQTVTETVTPTPHARRHVHHPRHPHH